MFCVNKFNTSEVIAPNGWQKTAKRMEGLLTESGWSHTVIWVLFVECPCTDQTCSDCTWSGSKSHGINTEKFLISLNEMMPHEPSDWWQHIGTKKDDLKYHLYVYKSKVTC